MCSHKIEGSFTIRYRGRAHNLKKAAKILLEAFPGVSNEDILPAGKEPLDLGVTLRNKFDYEPRPDRLEKFGDPIQWHIVSDRQMMNQGES